MNFDEIWKAATNEADWLRYYGHADTRMAEKFEDEKFYDRIISIGYTKVVTPLPMRCARGFVTGPKPVIECTPEELEYCSGPRDHDKNVYTPLEYMIGTKQRIEELIKIIQP